MMVILLLNTDTGKTMKMKRLIFNFSKNKVDIYNVSDSYLIKCDKLKNNSPSSLLAYLKSAEFYHIFLSKNIDIFNKYEIDDYRTTKTDGIWFWSADLNYYTENHCFVWPLDFVDHVEKQKTISLTLDEELYNIPIEIENTLSFVLKNISVDKQPRLEFKFINLE